MKKKVICGIIATVVVSALICDYIFIKIATDKRTEIKYFSRLETEIVREKDGTDFSINFFGIETKGSTRKVTGIRRTCKSSMWGTCDTSKEGFYPIKEGEAVKLNKRE